MKRKMLAMVMALAFAFTTPTVSIFASSDKYAESDDQLVKAEEKINEQIKEYKKLQDKESRRAKTATMLNHVKKLTQLMI